MYKRQELGLPYFDANLLSESVEKAAFFEHAVALDLCQPKNLSNWLLGDISRILNEKNCTLADTSLTPEKLCGMVSLIEKMCIRDSIQTIAGTEAKTYAVRAINDAVSDELTEESLRYENLVHLTYSEAGNVTALQTDITSMNILQSNITNRIVQQILTFDNQTVDVPIGTLLGGPFFSGRGPEVEIKIIRCV